MNHMDIEGRILQSLRPRRDGVLLRSDVNDFGSPSQVSAALKALLEKGLITRLDRGVYAKPDKVKQVGKDSLLLQAIAKMEQNRIQTFKRARQRRNDPTAIYVRQLAKREGIVFAPTFADLWAKAVTKLAGDEVKSDKTDDLLVALTRAGKLSPRDMTRLVIAHHRNLARV
jgi:DNA-binding transcriptional ArsR family regulator